MKSSKIDVIYIHSAGHSGSTILNLTLGGSQEVFSAGELQRIPEFLRGDRSCSCGERAAGCPLWSEALKKIRPERLFLIFSSWSDRIKIIKALYGGIRPRYKQYDNERLYTQVLAAARAVKAKEVSYILDSSKSLKHMMYLSTLPNIRLHVIQLERDGCEVLASALLRKASWLRTYLVWFFANLFGRRFLRKYGVDHRIISYDEFSKKPKETLDGLCEWLGIEKPANDLILAESQHNFGGNARVYKKKKADRIRHVKKIGEVPPIYRIIFKIIAAIPNKRWRL